MSTCAFPSIAPRSPNGAGAAWPMTAGNSASISTEPINHGAHFFAVGETYYVIEQLPEEVLEIPVTTPEQAARVAWSLGNLHFGVQVLAGAVRVAEDPAVLQLLAREGIAFPARDLCFPAALRRRASSSRPRRSSWMKRRVSLAGPAAAGQRLGVSHRRLCPFVRLRTNRAARPRPRCRIDAPTYRTPSLADADPLRVARRPLRAGGGAGGRSARPARTRRLRGRHQEPARIARSQPGHGSPQVGRPAPNRALA